MEKRGIKYLLAIIWLFVAATIISTPPKKPTTFTFPDNPQARFEFELLKTRDPATGKIPTNIRELELAFAASKQSGSQIPFAAGDISVAWLNRGPNNVGGRTRALAFDVADVTENIILAGGVSGGMWRSMDRGVSWTKTTDSDELQSVSCIAQDPRIMETSTWYYGTGELSGNSAGGTGAFFLGDGIYKSIDNGNSWNIFANTGEGTPLSAGDFDLNHEIVVNPTNGDVLIANIGGIYRITNDGLTTENPLMSPSGATWSDIVVSSTGVFYAAIEQNGVFTSTDGDIWTDITPMGMPRASGDRMELAISAFDENIVYALGEDTGAGTDQHTLWKYDATGMGGNWTDLSANLPMLGGQTGDFQSQGGYDLLIKIKPDVADFIVIGGRNLWRSTDGFSTTTETTWIGGYDPADPSNFGLYPAHHPDQHSFEFLSGNMAISGNDGGLQITLDITNSFLPNQPVDWVPMNNGYLTTQVFALSVGPGSQIFAGFQDNGTWLTNSTVGTTAWIETFSGDGGYSAWNNDGTRRFVSVQNGQIFRLNYDDANATANTSETEITPSGYSTSLFIVPQYLAPSDDNILLLGGDSELYVNTEASTSTSSVGWKSISLGTTGEISELGVTGVDNVYVGTSNGQIFLVESLSEATPTVTELTANLPVTYVSGYISGVGVNPFRANELLICLSNYSIPSIYYSNDSGTSWTDVSGDLEEFPTGTGNGPSVRVARIHGDGDRFFVGTSTGLYSTTTLDGVNTVWSPEDEMGMGNVVVEHMVTRVSDGLVVAGTHGNGVYSANFEVSAGLDNDLGINAITAPITGLQTTAEPVTTTVFNFGQLAQSAYDLSLFVDDVLIVTDNITAEIAANASFNHTFSTTVDLSAVTSARIKVQVILAGDGNNFNDELEKTIQNVFRVTNFPYFEGFESDDHMWEPALPWELGEPIDFAISAASEGIRAWVTDLDDNYANDLSANLISPALNFANLAEPKVSFDINHRFEAGFDGAVLGYRTDLTSAFTTVPISWGESGWYDTQDIGVFSNTPGWSGSSGGYVRAQAQLMELAGEDLVQLAFIMASDDSFTDEGIAVDNFLISDAAVVNNAPSFTVGPNIVIDENSIAQAIAGWATNISDGDNGTQSVTFSMTNDNNALFSVQPAITLTGDLSFTPLQDVFGVANVTVTLTDDAGTPPDLTDDLTQTTSFTITVIELVTGISSIVENSVQVYPNPTRGSIDIDFSGSSTQTRLSVYDLSGVRVIDEMDFTNDNSATLDFSGLPDGIYLLRVVSGSFKSTSRVVKN